MYLTFSALFLISSGIGGEGRGVLLNRPRVGGEGVEQGGYVT
jgi:hypothetical protein